MAASKTVLQALQRLGTALAAPAPPPPVHIVAPASPWRPSTVGRGPGGVAGAQGPIAPQGMTGPQGYAPATQGNPTHANVRKPSDQRFRSFAERYCVARAHLLTPDPLKLAEEQYNMVLDAKRFYAMIERTGQNINPEDGVF